MKIYKKVTTVLLMGCFPIACSAATINLSGEEAFKKTSMVLVNLGAIPTYRDKELLIIKTDPVQVKLTPNEADCGKMFGIPYLKDKRTKTAASYQVVIKSIDSVKSDILIKVTIDGYMDVNEGAPFFVEKTRDKNKALTCKSKGVLESQFMDLMTDNK